LKSWTAGDRCEILRSDGSWSLAKVTEVKPHANIIVAAVLVNGKWRPKTVPPSDLRPLQVCCKTSPDSEVYEFVAESQCSQSMVPIEHCRIQSLINEIIGLEDISEPAQREIRVNELKLEIKAFSEVDCQIKYLESKKIEG